MKICEHCGCIITPGYHHVRKQLTDTEWKCYTVLGPAPQPEPPAAAAKPGPIDQ